MKPSQFAYYEPTSVEQAVVMLDDVAPLDGRVIAGGQTLVPAMALRYAQPACLVDINGIESLRHLGVDGTSLVIGACVRHAAFHKPVVEGPLGKLLSTVVRHIAHLPIRHRGTFCGSLANADPSSEWCLVAVTLGATLEARSLSQQRAMEAQDFFMGFMSTALAQNELLVAARLPLLDTDVRFGFEEFSRRAGDFAQAMALVVFSMQDGRMVNVRVGVGGVENHPRRITEVEHMLEGQMADAALFDLAAAQAAREVVPVDVEAEEQAFRRTLVRTMVQRALKKAMVGTSSAA